mgnify:FL=1
MPPEDQYPPPSMFADLTREKRGGKPAFIRSQCRRFCRENALPVPPWAMLSEPAEAQQPHVAAGRPAPPRRSPPAATTAGHGPASGPTVHFHKGKRWTWDTPPAADRPYLEGDEFSAYQAYRTALRVKGQAQADKVR